MFAIYPTHAAPDDPLCALEIGEQPEPVAREGWVRVKISHASLKCHDLFTLSGITAHPEGISFPIILGNDGVGMLDDGTPVVIYPVVGGTTGLEVNLPLLPLISEQITVRGSIMGTLQDIKDMVSFIAASGITPESGLVLPMEQAAEGFRAMWEGRTHGKTVFTR